jgi:hypothetical protein
MSNNIIFVLMYHRHRVLDLIYSRIRLIEGDASKFQISRYGKGLEINYTLIHS